MNVTKRTDKPEESKSALPEQPDNAASSDAGQTLSLPEPIKYAISTLILVLGIGIAAGMSMLRESNAKIESDALIPLVDTANVSQFQGNLDLVVSGTVVPFRDIQVGAEVSGKIAKKYPFCEAGNFVEKGTPLIEIDPTDYHLEIKTVNSEILQAQRTIDETSQEIRGAMKSLEIAQSELNLQKSEYQRKIKMQRSLSPTELDQAKRNLLNSESQVTTRQNTYDSLLARKESLKASLELSQVRLQRAQLNLARTTIAAPVSGVIVRESVEEGNFVATSNALFVIEDTSRCEVVCNLTPGELSWLRKYSKDGGEGLNINNGDVYNVPKVNVEIFEQVAPEIVWDGVLERFDGNGRNVTTKSIPCRIVVHNPVAEVGNEAHVLVRGMFVKCRTVLSISQGLNLATIPLVAVRPGDYVWVVRDGRLKRIDVDVIDRSPIGSPGSGTKMVAIKLKNGLTMEDIVIVSPIPQPIEGGRVLMKDERNSEVVDRPKLEINRSAELSKPDEEPNGSDAERSEP